MASKQIKMIQSDNKPDSPFILYNPDGTRTNLTNVTTIKFYITEPGKTTPEINSSHETCVITNITQGEFKYVWQTTDTATVGDFEGQVRITWNDTTVESVFDPVTIVIKAKKGT